MKRRIFILISNIIVIAITCFIFPSNVAFAIDIIDAYSQVLDEYNSPLIEYTLFDVDKNGIEELIVNYGGSDGGMLYGYKNGLTFQYDGWLGGNVGFYNYNGDLYSIDSAIDTANEYSVTHSYCLGAITLSNDIVNRIVLWNGFITNTISFINSGYCDFNQQLSDASPITKNIISNGKLLEFYPTNDHSGLKTNTISVLLNGTTLLFDQPPIMADGDRVLLPIRKVAEAMGASVEWNQELQTAYIQHKDRVLIVPINREYLFIAKSDKPTEWYKYPLDVPSQEINGRTLMPVRAICESLGAEVNWNGSKQTVYIDYAVPTEYVPLTQDMIKGINMTYAIIANHSSMSFQRYTDEMYDFFYSRNNIIDNLAMSWGSGFFDGYKKLAALMTGENATETAVKLALANILAQIETVETDTQFIDGLKFTKKGLDTIYTLSNMPTKNLEIEHISDLKDIENIVPELKVLSDAIKDTGFIFDLTYFVREDVAYMLADYTQNIAYLDQIEQYFRKYGINDEIIYDSIESLKDDYTRKWVKKFDSIRDEFVELGITKLADYGTGNIFSIVNFANELTLELTGLSISADGLEEFYGICILNGAFDKVYIDMKNKVAESDYDPNEVKEMHKIQKAVKLAAFESLNKVANKVNSVLWDKQINEIRNMNYILW